MVTFCKVCGIRLKIDSPFSPSLLVERDDCVEDIIKVSDSIKLIFNCLQSPDYKKFLHC